MSKLSVTVIYLLFLKSSSPTPLLQAYNSTIHEGTNESAEFYIVGGFRPPVTESLSKYVVSLRKGSPKLSFGDNHHCGGSIIAPSVILTAAHCLVSGRNTNLSPKKLTVVAATPNRCTKSVNTKILKAKTIIRHKKYKHGVSFGFDIGLVRLDSTLKNDNKTVGFIPLAIKTPDPGTNCSIAGWGRLYEFGPLPEEIVHSYVAVVSFDYCKQKYNEELRDGMLCAGRYGKDSCSGDSGGPLVCNGKIAGIVSFGKGCAAGYPGVYTDVAYYRDWITRNCTAYCMLDVRMLEFLLAVNLYFLFK